MAFFIQVLVSLLRRFAVLILLTLSVQLNANPDLNDAHAMVNERIHELLKNIEVSKAGGDSSYAQRIEIVNSSIGVVVDFRRIARRVMAKFYKRASKPQKKRFFTVFKDSLLNTYASGLWEFQDYKIRLLPLKPGKAGKRKGQVEFEVITASGQVFPVSQSVFFHKKKQRWMVQNVIINGINMGQLFRDQFARLVSENNGDLDLAINAWSEEIQLTRQQLEQSAG